MSKKIGSDILTDRDVRALQGRIIACLAERYVGLTRIELNSKRQVPRARDAIVPTVPDGELERSLADVRLGSGGELRPPRSGGHPDFYSVRTACALAVSVFGRWRLEPMSLELAPFVTGWATEQGKKGKLRAAEAFRRMVLEDL